LANSFADCYSGNVRTVCRILVAGDPAISGNPTKTGDLSPFYEVW
jgi:hypothetical protein